jgi:hypothetical protein
MTPPLTRSTRAALSTAAVLACAIGGLAAAAPAPRPNAPFVAAVFPPWWSAQRVFGAAADVGDIVSTGGAPFTIVVHSARADLPTRLRARGAWLVLDARFAGCSPRKGSPV